MKSRKCHWGTNTMYGNRPGSRRKSATSYVLPSSLVNPTMGARWCGRAKNASASPISSSSRSVEAWIVSPRKSRRKSPCFSSRTTSTPARASSSAATAPAGPPPTTHTSAVVPPTVVPPAVVPPAAPVMPSPSRIPPARSRGHGGGGGTAAEDATGRHPTSATTVSIVAAQDDPKSNVARFRDNYQDEVDSAALYVAMAER